MFLEKCEVKRDKILGMYLQGTGEMISTWSSSVSVRNKITEREYGIERKSYYRCQRNMFLHSLGDVSKKCV